VFIKNLLIQSIILLLLMASAWATCSDEYAILVFDANNNEILEQIRAYDLKYPASLTKLMTLYLTFEAIGQGKLHYDTILTVSERAANQWKFNADLQAGETITVREAILGIIVRSFNDFAVVLAEAVGKNEWNFVKLMNKKAKELGLENTNFRNASGFTDARQETTAYDMMKLTRAIKTEFPKEYELFATKRFKFKDRIYDTHNHVLAQYPWAKGMKTGFTRASGYNLITTADKDGRNLIAVIISCSMKEDRDEFMISTLDKYFKNESNKYFIQQ
jgi:serine-type D-Ala-D-Ala carboxypeptidase (penicillin-binding protein 5/6)